MEEGEPQFDSGTAGMTTLFEGEWATVRRMRKGKLVVTNGPDQGREIEIAKPRVTGGRSIISDLVVQDKAVSGSHFEVSARDDGYRLRDLNSRNGIFVGDLRVREVYLRPGTVFRIGHTNIQFQSLQDVVEIELSKKDRFDLMLGSSPAMREIFAQLEKVAPSDLTCLITGETGTGKEMVARALHNASSRKQKPFVVLDCGSIPRELIESTLFGHEKGSFTGAVAQHTGCFEAGQRRHDLPRRDRRARHLAAAQAAARCSSSARSSASATRPHHYKVDVRVLAATNRDLREEVNKSTFREDLYFRLSVVHVELPPMRERREDIPSLANHFLRDIATRRGMTMSWSQDAMVALMSHAWPGNVREMRNVVERAAALSDGPVITRSDLVFGREMGPSIVASHDLAQAGAQAAQRAAAQLAGVDLPHTQGPATFDAALLKAGLGFKQAKQSVVDAFEMAYLQALMIRNDGNITRSAQEAGLTRYHLRELLKRHHLKGGEQE